MLPFVQIRKIHVPIKPANRTENMNLNNCSFELAKLYTYYNQILQKQQHTNTRNKHLSKHLINKILNV